MGDAFKSNRTLRLFVPAEIDDAGLDVDQFRVLCHVSRRGNCHEAVGNAARCCGMSARRYREALRFLVKGGWLLRQTRPGQSWIYQEADPYPKRTGVVCPKRTGEPLPNRGGDPCPKRTGKGYPYKGIQEGHTHSGGVVPDFVQEVQALEPGVDCAKCWPEFENYYAIRKKPRTRELFTSWVRREDVHLRSQRGSPWASDRRRALTDADHAKGF